MRLSIVLASGFLVGGIACAPAPQEEDEAVDLAAEQASVEQTLRDWLRATNEEGAEGWASYLTEDVVLLPPNAARIEGRDGAREYVTQFTEAENFHMNWEARDVAIARSGELAFGHGSYDWSLTDAEGNEVTDQGKWMDVFEKQPDGSWKTVAIMFSSDLPPPGTESD